MELIKNFGLDPVLLVVQIINFVIVLYILRRFLYKPVLSILQKRQESIKVGLQEAQEARIRLEKVLEEEKRILRRAKAEAEKIIEESKLSSLQLQKKIEEDTKNTAQNLINQAKEQIGREAMETEKMLSQNVSRLAVKFLQSALQNFFSERQQKEVIEKALEKVKKIN